MGGFKKNFMGFSIGEKNGEYVIKNTDKTDKSNADYQLKTRYNGIGEVHKLEDDDKDGSKMKEELLKSGFIEKYKPKYEERKNQNQSNNEETSSTNATQNAENSSKKDNQETKSTNNTEEKNEQKNIENNESNKNTNYRVTFKVDRLRFVVSGIKSTTGDIDKCIKDNKAYAWTGNHNNLGEETKNLYKFDSIKEAMQQLGLAKDSEDRKSTTPKLPNNQSYSNTDIIQLRNDVRTLSAKLDTIERTIRNTSKDYAQVSDDQTRKISNDVQFIVSEAVSDLATKKKLDNLLDDISDSMEDIKTNVKDSAPALETIQGKLSVIEELFSKKGVSIQKDIVPTNNDSKIIANAQKLAKRLLDDISVAALEYANNREIIENAAANEDKIRLEAGEQIERAKETAKIDLIKEILEGYSSTGEFFANSDNAIIVNVMKKYGLSEDEKLKSGNQIDISESEIEKFLTKAKGIENAGKYDVKESLFVIGEEVISKALVVKISE